MASVAGARPFSVPRLVASPSSGGSEGRPEYPEDGGGDTERVAGLVPGIRRDQDDDTGRKEEARCRSDHKSCEVVAAGHGITLSARALMFILPLSTVRRPGDVEFLLSQFRLRLSLVVLLFRSPSALMPTKEWSVILPRERRTRLAVYAALSEPKRRQ